VSKSSPWSGKFNQANHYCSYFVANTIHAERILLSGIHFGIYILLKLTESVVFFEACRWTGLRWPTAAKRYVRIGAAAWIGKPEGPTILTNRISNYRNLEIARKSTSEADEFVIEVSGVFCHFANGRGDSFVLSNSGWCMHCRSDG